MRSETGMEDCTQKPRAWMQASHCFVKSSKKASENTTKIDHILCLTVR